ncbi:S8 family peptidase [Actinoallomurus iriomotensis]|uniref:S8 family peptidase n=1 Tax=Actinoallomurus iriomotensis TaxID=478107 RepID=UPI002556A11A|nr:S8 family serine peptidase [Actinoallomurus iriomotensis]
MLPAVMLLLGLAPPLTGESRAGTSGWASQMTQDLLAAQRISDGSSVKIALLTDGVASGVRSLKDALEKEKDLVGTPRPERRSGTLMASLIVGGAPVGSSVGIRGLAPAARILPIRVYAAAYEPGGRTWQETAHWGTILANGVRYAVDHGADVIAVDAYATGPETAELRAAITYAQTKKVVVVAAINVQKPDDPPAYPVSAPGVIGVGTVAKDGRRDGKSTSRSSSIIVSAPGTTVPSIGPDNRPWTFWGTPVALTFTTAAVAMVRSKYPQLTPAQVGQALSASARRPKGKGRYDTDLGFGYLNPVGALDEAHRLTEQTAPAMTAKSSVPDKARLGDRPGTIRAVPYDAPVIGGFGGLALAGLVALGFAVRLALRKRPVPHPAPAEPADTTEPDTATS